jgi:hypothetical protein
MREVVQKRRSERPRDLSPTVQQALDEFDGTVAKLERQVDALLPKRMPELPPVEIEFGDAVRDVRELWEAAHPEARSAGEAATTEGLVAQPINDADRGAADFAVEQVAILALEALRRGGNPERVRIAMAELAGVIGCDTDLGQALKRVSDLAAVTGKFPVEMAQRSMADVEGLLDQAGALIQDSGLTQKARRAIDIADRVDDLFELGLKEEAKKLVDEYVKISGELGGVLDDGGSQNKDSAMVAAASVMQAGLKIAETCRKWDELSDLGKVSAALDGLTSAAMAAQAFCSVAVCQVKGPILVLVLLLKDLFDLGLDIGGSGSGGGDASNEGDDDSSSDEEGETSAAGEAADSAASQPGATAEEVAEAVVQAIDGDAAVKRAVTECVENALSSGKDVAQAVRELRAVKQAEEQLGEQEAETAREAADKANQEGKPDNPDTLAAGTDVGDSHDLRNLIVDELNAGRTPEEAVRRALIRLRGIKAGRGIRDINNVK